MWRAWTDAKTLTCGMGQQQTRDGAEGGVTAS